MLAKFEQLTAHNRIKNCEEANEKVRDGKGRDLPRILAKPLLEDFGGILHPVEFQARNDQGQTVRSRMRTPEGYSLTAATAFDAAYRVVAGEIKPGFQTPSRAFGADYILNFDGVVCEDLNR